jgi:chaperonin GroEL (HSP60 family)
MLRKMVEKIARIGANVLICQKGIDDIVQYLLAKEGIYAVRRASENDIKKLAKATGAKIIANLDDLNINDLGYAGIVEEKKYGDEKFTFIMKCKNPKAVSIMLRGGTEHVVDELERGLHDSLSVVKVALEDGKIITGGGSTASAIAMGLRAYASSVGGREQMAIDAFANAMEIIPKTLSQNAGLDPIDIMLKIRTEHKKGNNYAGVNVLEKKIDNMLKNKVIEPIRLGLNEIRAASETATMIIRIDDVIASKSGGGRMSPGPPGGGISDMGEY